MALAVRWGTWEELILGGAVLRHGIHAWDAVSSELRARSPFPQLFTPEECEAKYDDLQERFSGCDAWFEELRKQRVAELKRELEKSEDSIGSLQSKLENLTSERESDCNFEYNTSRTESTSPTEDGDGIDSSSKEPSKNGSSAGSFIEKRSRDWSTGCQILASALSQDNDHEMQSSEDSRKEKIWCGCSEIGFGNFKRKRGKRKRKSSNVVKEGSAGNSETLSSAAFVDREGSSEGCNQDVKALCEDSSGNLRGEDTQVDLERIMNSIMEHNDVSIFRRRLESQKRARYKKMIRRHIDFQSINLRIAIGSISSAKELFRDLLLLSNNAMVFYPKNSLEHKSALILRDLVTKSLTLSSQNPSWSFCDRGSAVPVEGDKPRKLQSVKPGGHNVSKDTVVVGKGDGAPIIERKKKASPIDGVVASPGRKRGVGRPVKGGRKGGRIRQEKLNKGRKRTRR